MRKAVIDGTGATSGLVENVIEAPADFVLGGKTLINAKDGGSPGDTWDGTTFTAPPPLLKPKLRYDAARRVAYGPIPDQLDMQYWDSVNDTTVWADHIAAVKAAHPKPE